MRKLAIILATTLALLSTISCSKDDVVAGDNDNNGKFELTFDGTKYSGTKVTNLSAIGVRTISAENDNFSFQLILPEDQFIAGKSYDLDTDNLDPMITLDVNKDNTEEVYWGVTGTVKIISKDKIEIDANFYENWQTTNPVNKVTGYISSK